MCGIGIRMQRSSRDRSTATSSAGVPPALYFLQLMVSKSALCVPSLAEAPIETCWSGVPILLESILLIRVLTVCQGRGRKRRSALEDGVDRWILMFFADGSTSCHSASMRPLFPSITPVVGKLLFALVRRITPIAGTIGPFLLRPAIS